MITKGPWTLKILDKELGKPIYRIETIERINPNYGYHICNINEKFSDVANIVAAAPEMLNTLELILNDNKLMNAMTKEQAHKIMSAVSKAKGNQESQ